MNLFHLFHFRKVNCITFLVIFYLFLSPDYIYGFPPAKLKTRTKTSYAPEKVAKGIVVNEDGEPLKGVRIIVSKSLISVTTDVWGRFAINNIPDGSSLIFSCRGYKTFSMPPLIVSNSALHVRLVKDHDFDEKSQDIVKQKEDSTDNPLIVINGNIAEISIEELNPMIIDSLYILKEKAATDKYGAGGKNGVIEIITKKPAKEDELVPRNRDSKSKIKVN